MSAENFEMEKYLQGSVLIGEWLTNAFRNSETHGPYLIKKIESFFDDLPEAYGNFLIKEKISFLRSRISRLPKSVLEQAVDFLTSNPVANEADFSIEGLLEILGDKKRLNISRVALKELSKKMKIDRVKLVLFTDGQEAIFVEVAGEDFRIDQIFETKLLPDEIQQRIEKLDGLIPKTQVIFLEDGRVVVLNKKESGHFVTNKQKAVELADKIFNETGFVADLNGQNFLQLDDETLVYVDRDVNSWIIGKEENKDHDDLEREKTRFLK